MQLQSICLLACIASGSYAAGLVQTRQSANNTANTSKLKTWWHGTGKINTNSAVAPRDVRQSHKYSVQVQASGDSQYYDSFVYESIPRNGLGPSSDPSNLNTNNAKQDGITIESDIGASMAWSSFLYSTGVNVKIHRTDGKSIDLNSVTVRPTTLGYGKSLDNGDLIISVPYSATGTKFSVEFGDDLYSYHNKDGGPSSIFVQTNNSQNSDYYVSSFTSSMPVMGVEPLNALLIFASANETADMIPDRNAPSTYIGRGGQIDTSGLRSASNTALYFDPGVHYCGGSSQIVLSNSIYWVYFSPGAYVKCSIVWGEPGANKQTLFKATGHGVLSGEQYVFQADPSNSFKTRPGGSSDEPVRMWRGQSTSGLQQYFVLNGPTVNAPPFQSMDFTGELSSLSCYVNDYKMVGAWFGETDGLENYPGSRVADVFYHSNDDTLKMYYSNTTIQRVTVWKGTTAPVIQFGWHSYNLNNVIVDSVNTIHARWNRNDSHPSVIGANQDFSAYVQGGDNWTNTSNVANTAQNIQFSNIRVEGIGGSLFRICPLETFSNFTLSNISIEQRTVNSSFVPISEFSYFTDSSHNSGVGVSNFLIQNFTIGGTRITTAANNYDSKSLGGLNIAPEYLHAGGVTIT